MVARRNCTNNTFDIICGFFRSLLQYIWCILMIHVATRVCTRESISRFSVGRKWNADFGEWRHQYQESKESSIKKKKTIPSVAMNTIVPSCIEFRTVSRITEEKLVQLNPALTDPLLTEFRLKQIYSLLIIVFLFITNYWSLQPIFFHFFIMAITKFYL